MKSTKSLLMKRTKSHYGEDDEKEEGSIFKRKKDAMKQKKAKRESFINIFS